MKSQRAYFVDGLGHYIDAHIVPTSRQARKIIPKWGTFQGCCEFDHRGKHDRKAVLVFLERRYDLALLVHEIVHAAINYVCEYEMPLAPKRAGEARLRAHYEEAVSRVAEHLFRQFYATLSGTPSRCRGHLSR